MKQNEFCQETGATPRQVDYWSYSMELIEPMRKGGRGNHRQYKRSAVPKVRLLVSISAKLGGYFSVDILKLIFDSYEAGRYDFGDGLVLEWRVDAPA